MSWRKIRQTEIQQKEIRETKIRCPRARISSRKPNQLPKSARATKIESARIERISSRYPDATNQLEMRISSRYPDVANQLPLRISSNLANQLALPL